MIRVETEGRFTVERQQMRKTGNQSLSKEGLGSFRVILCLYSKTVGMAFIVITHKRSSSEIVSEKTN